MKRMAPLLIILVLVLAPAAWGYNVSLIPSAETIGFSSVATMGGFTDSGLPIQTLSELGVFKYQTSTADTNKLAVPPDSRAMSSWVAKVYEPIVTWDADNVGKTTTIKQEINVSMLLAFVDPSTSGHTGTSASFRTNFSAVQEDMSTDPIVTLELSTSKTGLNLSPTFSTSVKHLVGYPPFPQYIFNQDDTPPLLPLFQTPDNLDNLTDYTTNFVLALDVNALLDKISSAAVDPDHPATFAGDLIVTESLNFYEPNIVNPNPAVVPVPPSLILFGSSLLGLGFMVRRRQS